MLHPLIEAANIGQNRKNTLAYFVESFNDAEKV